MYDEIVKTIELTSDEVSILREMLVARSDSCVSLGEEFTVTALLDKLSR